MASTLDSFRGGAVGFIDWLDGRRGNFEDSNAGLPIEDSAFESLAVIGFDVHQFIAGDTAFGQIFFDDIHGYLPILDQVGDISIHLCLSG